MWAAPQKAPIKKPLPRPKLIALDPGHGGRDPGALGYNGTPRKRVSSSPSPASCRSSSSPATAHRVILTRSIDTYVPAARAGSAGPGGEGRPVPVDPRRLPFGPRGPRRLRLYPVGGGERPGGRGAGGARESRHTTVAPSSTVARTLVAMAQRGTVNDSRRLAETIVGTFGQAGIRLLRIAIARPASRCSPHPDIPAALVELGYLSNPRDEKLLTVPQHQLALARALRASVDAHFGSSGKSQKGLSVSAAARDAPRSAAPPRPSPLAGRNMQELVGSVRVRVRTQHPRDDELRIRKFLTQHPMKGIEPPSPM